MLRGQHTPSVLIEPPAAAPPPTADLLAARDRILGGLAAAGFGSAEVRKCFAFDEPEAVRAAACAALGRGTRRTAGARDARTPARARDGIIGMLHALVNADAGMLARDRPLQFLGLAQALDVLGGTKLADTTTSFDVDDDESLEAAAAARSVLATIEQVVRALT